MNGCRSTENKKCSRLCLGNKSYSYKSCQKLSVRIRKIAQLLKRNDWRAVPPLSPFSNATFNSVTTVMFCATSMVNSATNCYSSEIPQDNSVTTVIRLAMANVVRVLATLMVNFVTNRSSFARSDNNSVTVKIARSYDNCATAVSFGRSNNNSDIVGISSVYCCSFAKSHDYSVTVVLVFVKSNDNSVTVVVFCEVERQLRYRLWNSAIIGRTVASLLLLTVLRPGPFTPLPSFSFC